MRLEVITKTIDAVLLPPVIDLLIRTITASVIRCRMRTQTIRDGLNQGWAASGTCTSECLFRGGINGAHIITVNAKAVKAIRFSFNRDRLRRCLHLQRKGDRELIVAAKKN